MREFSVKAGAAALALTAAVGLGIPTAGTAAYAKEKAQCRKGEIMTQTVKTPEPGKKKGYTIKNYYYTCKKGRWVRHEGVPPTGR